NILHRIIRDLDLLEGLQVFHAVGPPDNVLQPRVTGSNRSVVRNKTFCTPGVMAEDCVCDLGLVGFRCRSAKSGATPIEIDLSRRIYNISPTVYVQGRERVRLIDADIPACADQINARVAVWMTVLRGTTGGHYKHSVARGARRPGEGTGDL